MKKTKVLKCGSREFKLGTKTHVVGILNLTPDSFSDGGRLANVDEALARARQLLAEGADMLDLGGESTRPGADPVSSSEELERVIPVVERLVQEGIDCLSIDTRNASTARAARCAGASWLNDVSALGHDPAMLDVAQEFDAVVLMHARGTPKNMQEGSLLYEDVVDEVRSFLIERSRWLENTGFPKERILFDPGIGFGKNLPQNLELSRKLGHFKIGGHPLYYGPSRKRFLGELTGISTPALRDIPTFAALAAAAGRGADFVRVHDVAGSVATLKVQAALA